MICVYVVFCVCSVCTNIGYVCWVHTCNRCARVAGTHTGTLAMTPRYAVIAVMLMLMMALQGRLMLLLLLLTTITAIQMNEGMCGTQSRSVTAVQRMIAVQAMLLVEVMKMVLVLLLLQLVDLLLLLLIIMKMLVLTHAADTAAAIHAAVHVQAQFRAVETVVEHCHAVLQIEQSCCVVSAVC